VKHQIVLDDLSSIVQQTQSELQTLSGKYVLVTGGAGFLGHWIVATLAYANEHLLDKPCQITIIDNLITGYKKPLVSELENGHVRFIKHDIRKSIPNAIRADYVLHAAGLASPQNYKQYPLETIEVATIGTKNVLEYSKRHRLEGVLYFSTSEVYGDPPPEYIPTPEEYWGFVSARGPRAAYDESKRLGETLCLVYHQLAQVPVKTIRLFNVYGPGMKVDDFRVVPTFIAAALTGKPLKVHGSGNQTRTFCYVTDALQGIFKVLVKGKINEPYNVGRDQEEISMFDLATSIQKLSPKEVRVQRVDYPWSYPAGEASRRCPDITKIRSLGYHPHTDLTAGLTKTIAWYQGIRP